MRSIGNFKSQKNKFQKNQKEEKFQMNPFLIFFFLDFVLFGNWGLDFGASAATQRWSAARG